MQAACRRTQNGILLEAVAKWLESTSRQRPFLRKGAGFTGFAESAEKAKRAKDKEETAGVKDKSQNGNKSVKSGGKGSRKQPKTAETSRKVTKRATFSCFDNPARYPPRQRLGIARVGRVGKQGDLLEGNGYFENSHLAQNCKLQGLLRPLSCSFSNRA